jgi:hypothetical protein
MPEISHRQVHATGEKRHRQEQNGCRQEQKKSEKKTVLIGKSLLIVACTLK